MAPYNDEAAEDDEEQEDQRRIQDFYRNIGEKQKQCMESGSGTCIRRWQTKIPIANIVCRVQNSRKRT